MPYHSDQYYHEIKKLIQNSGDKLTHREKDVLEMRFGIRDGKTHTLEETGREFGVTRERVRQIEAKALMIMRSGERKEWIIWSIEHQAWWGPNGMGYLAMRADAGRYTFEEACRIVTGANIGQHDIPNEAMIKLTHDEYEREA